MKQQTLINDDSINHKERVLPEWCKCMLWDWEGYETIPPACNFFIDNGNGYCCNCGHSIDCHSQNEQNRHLRKENVRLIADVVMMQSQFGNTNLLPDIIHELISRSFAHSR